MFAEFPTSQPCPRIWGHSSGDSQHPPCRNQPPGSQQAHGPFCTAVLSTLHRANFIIYIYFCPLGAGLMQLPTKPHFGKSRKSEGRTGGKGFEEFCCFASFTTTSRRWEERRGREISCFGPWPHGWHQGTACFAHPEQLVLS